MESQTQRKLIRTGISARKNILPDCANEQLFIRIVIIYNFILCDM